MTEQEIARLVGAVIEALPQGSITLEKANLLIAAVRERAAQMGVKAVVAIADKHANPVSVQCMDDSYIASYDIAVNKAFTVTSLKMPTTALKTLATPGGSLYGIQFTNSGRIVIFGGGVPLYDKNGNIVGGLGVSGGSEEQDTALAEYGAEWYKANLM
ncbi:MAG: heme-binding protein [Clostridia bacterium]|nr:heme-binding protein [Clostridia bacterium]